ncbi:MAG: sensor histidine kinase, partial [Coleofasciculus sp. C2-GNP5-27]
APVNLTSMSLAQILQTSIPHWQKQAQRRNVSLDVVLPQNLPTVVSNPAMLDQVLTGLVENFTRTLPAGGHIQVQVTPAGDQLKLQFHSQPDPNNSGNLDKFGQSTCQTLKSICQLLLFQPETGSLSLNLNVTKHLFQALGGKLIVRQRPQAGEVMTIFLPLEVTNNSSNQEGILV